MAAMPIKECTSHARIVDLIVKDISNHFSSSVKMCKHSCVKPSMFQNCNSSETFSHVFANTPDVVVVNEEISEVFVWRLHVPLTLVWRKPL